MVSFLCSSLGASEIGMEAGMTIFCILHFFYSFLRYKHGMIKKIKIIIANVLTSSPQHR